MVVAAPAVAVVALVALYGFLDSTHRGPDATYWNRVRRQYLPGLDRLARRLGLGYAAYELNAEEFAGRMDESVEDVEALLAANGFERMPLSAWKTLPDGRGEVGSWARRDSPLAERQLHVMLFRGPDGTTELYAHEEFNPFNPRYASKHYHCIGHDPAAGTEQVAALFDDRLVEPAELDDAPSVAESSEPITAESETADPLSTEHASDSPSPTHEPESTRNHNSGAAAD
ncbi:hypothetical protein EGH24_07080 [Halonotius terrestris]|uniref:Uncharacterized protein n=1 Tax=Halonotius terrestris TaxID=2487750 RepID=A0A8J8PBB0_9EURY|nr:hypothetical protein [Halonotius terrestris]TQQ80913.1 hypothetical protein EGH24_07080 [Halonotius terrestris]